MASCCWYMKSVKEGRFGWAQIFKKDSDPSPATENQKEAAKSAKEEDEEDEKDENLLRQIKNAGPAGVIAYAIITEVGFWPYPWSWSSAAMWPWKTLAGLVQSTRNGKIGRGSLCLCQCRQVRGAPADWIGTWLDSVDSKEHFGSIPKERRNSRWEWKLVILNSQSMEGARS